MHTCTCLYICVRIWLRVYVRACTHLHAHTRHIRTCVQPPERPLSTRNRRTPPAKRPKYGDFVDGSDDDQDESNDGHDMDEEDDDGEDDDDEDDDDDDSFNRGRDNMVGASHSLQRFMKYVNASMH